MKPSFWADAKIADLAEPTRLFYIGLWMVADDAGWFRWDVREVARDLYGYEQPRRREARAERMFMELAVASRVILHPCGHAEVPHLPEHQRLSGATKQVKTNLNDHLRRCLDSGTPDNPRTSPHVPGTERIGTGTRNGNVEERLGTDSAGATELSEFRARVPRPVVVA